MASHASQTSQASWSMSKCPKHAVSTHRGFVADHTRPAPCEHLPSRLPSRESDAFPVGSLL
eukprot:scaffold35722_cov32-Tisochrysis_lutea.AAC.4